MEWTKRLDMPYVSEEGKQAWRKVCVQSGVLFTRRRSGLPARTRLLFERGVQPPPPPHRSPPPDLQPSLKEPQVDVPGVMEQPQIPVAEDEFVVPPPTGAGCQGDTWQPLRPSSTGQLGCHAFVGPEPVIREGKDNQDFAFCMERGDAAGETWLLCGVADGVTQASWQVRGAQQAIAAFVETVGTMLSEHMDLLGELQSGGGIERFSARFTQETLRRLRKDQERFENERLLPPKLKNAEFYLSYYFNQESGAQRRRDKWFLSTLLAAALGPRGGFVLLLGDGFIRTDRWYGNNLQSSAEELEGDESQGHRPARGPSAVICTDLSELTVSQRLRLVLPQGAEALRIILSTDGLMKTPENGLRELDPQSSNDCMEHIRSICNRTAAEVHPDNLSLAFCKRRVSP